MKFWGSLVSDKVKSSNNSFMCPDPSHFWCGFVTSLKSWCIFFGVFHRWQISGEWNMKHYPLVDIQKASKSHGKPAVLIAKSSIHGSFSIAMLVITRGYLDNLRVASLTHSHHPQVIIFMGGISTQSASHGRFMAMGESHITFIYIYIYNLYTHIYIYIYNGLVWKWGGLPFQREYHIILNFFMDIFGFLSR